MTLKPLYILVCLTMLASGCQRAAIPEAASARSAAEPWVYSDLRLIDPLDSRLPTQELAALYARLDETNVHLRLDLLELAETPDFDLYLAVDFLPGGGLDLPIDSKPGLPWDAFFKIPARGDIEVSLAAPTLPPGDLFSGSTAIGVRNAMGAPGLRLRRDPIQDSLVLSLNRSSLGEAGPTPGASVQIWLTPPGEKEVIDSAGPIRLNTPPPPPAQVILAFWNSLPAYTPLQALRRWDGAHTGPLGGRHGLLPLLRAARQTSTPLFLLDLNQPAGLSALEFFEQASLVRAMQSTGQLGLPLVLPGFIESRQLTPPAWALEQLIGLNRDTAKLFGVNEAAAWFIPGGLAAWHLLAAAQTGRYRQTAFVLDRAGTPQSEAGKIAFSQPMAWKNWLILPLPLTDENTAQETQVDRGGLTLAARAALVQTALATARHAPGAAPVLVLGGDLPQSAWGSPDVARISLEYIHDHPWIQLLGPADLVRLAPPTSPTTARLDPIPASTWQPAWLEDLRTAPDNPLSQAAWQALQAVYAPTYPGSGRLAELRQEYAGGINMLLLAAHWAEAPGSLANCAVDVDGDGQEECLLASERVLAIFEKDNGGGLAYLFILDETGSPHQVIAPSSLNINGLSPSESWNRSGVRLVDPETIPGAFFDLDSPLADLPAVDLSPDGLRFVQPDQPLEKSFRLLPAGLAVSLKNTEGDRAGSRLLPLNLDPWTRFEPGWTERCESTFLGQTWRWDCGAVLVEVQCSAPFLTRDSLSGADRLNRPENPDEDLRPEQRLPFPLALAEFSSTADFTCMIRLGSPR